MISINGIIFIKYIIISFPIPSGLRVPPSGEEKIVLKKKESCLEKKDLTLATVIRLKCLYKIPISLHKQYLLRLSRRSEGDRYGGGGGDG